MVSRPKYCIKTPLNEFYTRNGIHLYLNYAVDTEFLLAQNRLSLMVKMKLLNYEISLVLLGQI